MYDRLLFKIAFLSALTVAAGSAMADGAPLPLAIPMLPAPDVVAPEPDAVTIVPNEVVLARGPYHSATSTTTCANNGDVCHILFPKVPTKRRVEISNISCFLEAGPGAQAVALYNTSAAKNAVFGTLPLQLQVATSGTVIWSSNETVFIPINAGERLIIVTEQSAKAFQFACGITGQFLALK